MRDELRAQRVPLPQQAQVPFGSLTSEVDHIPDETRGANLEAIYTWAQGFRSLVGFDFKDRWVHSESDLFCLRAACATDLNP